MPQKRKRQRRSRGAGAGGGGRIPAPPAFNATIVFRKKFRFQANSAAANQPTYLTDLKDLLCFATGSTAAYELASGVRLRRVQIWGPMASNLTPVTAAVEFPPLAVAVGQPSMITSDTSMGATRAAYVNARPKPQSFAGNWLPSAGLSGATTTPVMYLTYPTGAVVDVDLDFVLQNAESPQAVNATVSAATVGKIYVRGLDEIATSGSPTLVPVGYPTI